MIALEGFIPTGEARARILSSAAGKAAGAAVSDATRIGSGAPQGDFIGAIDVALDKLGKLASGKVALSDAGLTIEGEGRQNVVAATLEADIWVGRTPSIVHGWRPLSAFFRSSRC